MRSTRIVIHSQTNYCQFSGDVPHTPYFFSPTRTLWQRWKKGHREIAIGEESYAAKHNRLRLHPVTRRVHGGRHGRRSTTGRSLGTGGPASFLRGLVVRSIRDAAGAAAGAVAVGQAALRLQHT